MTINNTEKKKILSSHFKELGIKSSKKFKEGKTPEEITEYMQNLQKKSVEARLKNKQLKETDE